MSASFPLRGQASIIGRDPGNDICIRDDPKVSRRHAQIKREGGRFTISDLGSSNGTFVNGSRVNNAALDEGDRIRIGGAEFQLQGDHLISTSVEATVVMRAGGGGMAPRPARPVGRGGFGMGWIPLVMGVGVVLLLATNQMGQKTPTTGQGTAQSVAGVATSGDTSRNTTGSSTQSDRDMTSSDIFAASKGSVVFLEVGWKLIQTSTGKQVYQKAYPLDDGTLVAHYHCMAGSIEDCLQDPSQLDYDLTLDPGTSSAPNAAIGGELAGTGFVVSRDGFIVTNRHVAAHWFAPTGLLPGYIVTDDDESLLYDDLVLGPVVIPADLIDDPKIGKSLEGRNDYLDVTFPNNANRIRAQLVRASDDHDVALVKIDLPSPVMPVNLVDSSESLRTGDAITVIGYPLPGTLSNNLAIERSQTGFGERDRTKYVPDATVGTGAIARIVKKGDDTFVVTEGETFQITAPINPGNSGGPLFDAHGDVIGVVNSGYSADVAQGANFAVPAKYAIELLGVRPPQP